TDLLGTFPGTWYFQCFSSRSRSRAGGQPLRRPGSWPESRRPESRLILGVSARTPRRKACSQWRTWKVACCIGVMILTMRSVHVLPWAVTGIGGNEGVNGMSRTDASVPGFHGPCLDALAD